MEINFLYIISGISILLGFIALLKQKTYLDARTSQPTSIEVSKLGKMKSNYPALVFVFLGFALAVIATMNRDKKIGPNANKVTWTIKGSFKNPKIIDSNTNWDLFSVELKETDIVYVVDDNGTYTITFPLDSAEKPEDKFSRLELSAPCEQAINMETIFLDDGLNTHPKLKKKAPRYREYIYPDVTPDSVTNDGQ